MSEVIDLVREDDVQNERTAGMIRAVNENYRRMSEAERQAFRKNQNRIRALEEEARMEEQARQARMAELWRLFWASFAWAAGSTVLVILAHTAAIAGWVMQIGTTALSLVLGYVVGQTAK